MIETVIFKVEWNGIIYIDHNLVLLLLEQAHIQKGFTTNQSVWNPKFLTQINKDLKILK